MSAFMYTSTQEHRLDQKQRFRPVTCIYRFFIQVTAAVWVVNQSIPYAGMFHFKTWPGHTRNSMVGTASPHLRPTFLHACRLCLSMHSVQNAF